LHQSGLVFGVVQVIANPEAFVKRFGHLPQNIGFAIKETVLKSFLDVHGVAYIECRSESAPDHLADIANDASNYVFSNQV
jgi:hypothetical protein